MAGLLQFWHLPSSLAFCLCSSPDPAMSRPRSSPSMRENFLNRCGRRSAGTPTPSSATERATDAIAHGGDPDGGQLVRVPGRIGQQVVQHLDDAPPVRQDPGQVGRNIDNQVTPAAPALEPAPSLVHQDTFTIPVAQDAGIGAANLPVRSRRSERERTRILAVDDDPQTLRHVRDALTNAGYAPVVTGDREEALSQVEANDPHLVLLDLMLPGTDGIELMRGILDMADVPVIFLSAYGQEETIARALPRKAKAETWPSRTSLGGLGRVGLDEASVAVGQVQDEVVGLPLHPADDHQGLAKVALGVARRMRQRDEHLLRPAAMLPYVVLDYGVLAAEPMLVPEPLEDPLGCVALLPGTPEVV